jgi:hypothetical protein
MRRAQISLATLLFLSFAACANQDNGAAKPEKHALPVEKGAPTQAAPDNKCSYKFKGDCFASAADACEAAGCPDDCSIAETFPGKPICGTGKAKAQPAAPATNAGQLDPDIETILTSVPQAQGRFARAIVTRQEIFHLLTLEMLSPGLDDGDPTTILKSTTLEKIHGEPVYRAEDLKWKGDTLYFKLTPARGAALTCSVVIAGDDFAAPRCAGIATP